MPTLADLQSLRGQSSQPTLADLQAARGKSTSSQPDSAKKQFSWKDLGNAALEDLNSGAEKAIELSKPPRPGDIEESSRKGLDAAMSVGAPELLGKAPVPAIKGAVAAAKAIPPIAKSVAKGVAESDLGRGVSAQHLKHMEPAVEDTKKVSRSAYKKAREGGVVLNNQSSGAILDGVRQSLESMGKNNSELHKKTLSALRDLEKDVKAGNVSLDTMDQNRQLFSNIAHQEYDKINGLSQDGLKAQKAARAIDVLMQRIKPEHLVKGDAKAIQHLNEGRAQWGKARRMERVVDIIRKADNDPAKLAAAMKKFTDVKKNLMGYSPEQIKAMKAMAKPGFAQNALGLVGKTGIDLHNPKKGSALPLIEGIAGASGAPHMFPVIAGGTLAKQGEHYMSKGKADKLIELLKNPSQLTQGISNGR